MITYNSVDHCFDPNPVRVAGSSKASAAAIGGLVLAAAVFATTEYLSLRLPSPEGGALGSGAAALAAPGILAVLSVLVLATTRSAQDRSSILWGFAAILLAANLISIFAVSVPLVLIGHLLFGFGIGGFAVGVITLARAK